MGYFHETVMKKEVLEYLRPGPGMNFIDCTLGGGGHALAMAKKIVPGGTVIGIDLDGSAIGYVRKRAEKEGLKNVIFVHDNFGNLSEIAGARRADSRRPCKNAERGRKDERRIFGIVFDLGLSSAQLEDRHRGFSFRLDAPLDMNFSRPEDADGRESTEEIVNGRSAEELEHIFRFYGEERYAGRIARAIAGARKRAPIRRTGRLVEIILGAAPKRSGGRKIHPATRVFQALRIATNHELENLEKALPQAVELLSGGGRLAVISYHSLEDRIVKNFIRRESRDCLCPSDFPVCRCGHKAVIRPVTRGVVIPGEEEIRRNPRSRSAKLRVAEKL